jgi:hypothetical protein
MLQSFFGQFFTALQNRITAQVPAVRWVDQDLGQLEHYDIRPAVSFPCVLLDFTETTYDQEGNQVQFGTATVQVRIGFPAFSPSNNTTPTSAKEMALQFWEQEMAVYQALQGWNPADLCQPLTRTTAITEKREDAIRVRVLLFTTAFKDASAAPQRKRVKATPQISLPTT